MEWQEGIRSELEFWESWYRTKGLDWPDDYLFRINPNSEIQEHVAVHLITGDELILDVGAGPLTVLGKKWKGIRLNIIACDALAIWYGDMNARYGISPLVVTEPCRAELLSVRYKPESFDVVYAQNCIDHSEDPVTAIVEMIRVCRKGGVVLFKHEQNEAENEGYAGLHQWNFDCVAGAFIVSGVDSRTNMDAYLSTIFDGLSIETRLEDGYVITVIRKL